MRSKQISNPVRKYHVPYAELRDVVANLPPHQKNQPLVYCETPPDDKRTVQGEICYDLFGRWHRRPGFHLEYTTVGLPMRLAFDVERITATGLQALFVLQQHLTPTDLDELRQLLDDYPQHVVEFSAFSEYVGTHPGHKMFVWEVRSY